MPLLMKPVASILGIHQENMFANQLLFGSSGGFLGFDKNKPTSRSGGKATAVQQIRKVHGYKTLATLGDGATDLEVFQVHGYKTLATLGDGATDLEARRPGGADLFICYAGGQFR